MKTKAISIVEQLERERYPTNHASFKGGDTIRVQYSRVNIKDHKKKDTFLFEGIVYGVNGRSKTVYVLKPDKDKSLTMRGHFSLLSPNVTIFLVSSATRRQVRKKLYYLSDLSGKKVSTKILK
jgi:ribosomal protein L19